jgi:hypothetical protein
MSHLTRRMRKVNQLILDLKPRMTSKLTKRGRASQGNQTSCQRVPSWSAESITWVFLWVQKNCKWVQQRHMRYHPWNCAHHIQRLTGERWSWHSKSSLGEAVKTILLCVLFTSWRFYAFSGINLLTRRHSASSLFSAIFVFQKSYTGNILEIGQNKSRTSYFSRTWVRVQSRDGGGPGPGHT